jgi:hypothetical protein
MTFMYRLQEGKLRAGSIYLRQERCQAAVRESMRCAASLAFMPGLTPSACALALAAEMMPSR